MMTIGSDQWIDLVRDGAARLGVTVGHDQAMQFAAHGRWMMEWNRKTNLTAIKDPAQIAVKHYVDAIAPLQYIPARGHLLDIGTGGGFPGIPLKIMRPDQPMTLIDSVRKKISFVKHVIRGLSLEGIVACHTRAEELGRRGQDPVEYKVVICRALTDRESAVRLAAPLMAKDAKIILYQGPHQSDEPGHLSSDRCEVNGIVYYQKVVSYTLPVYGDARKVSVLERG